MARRPASDPTTKHPSQLLALIIGAVYTLVGIAGFLVTGFENFAAETDKTLLGFEINPLHNLVHLAIGLAGLLLWRRLDTARAVSPTAAPERSARRCDPRPQRRAVRYRHPTPRTLSMRALRLWAAAGPAHSTTASRPDDGTPRQDIGS